MFTDTDVSLGAGLGLDFPAGGGSFSLEGRYSGGLTNILASPGDVSVKNSGVQFLVGMNF